MFHSTCDEVQLRWLARDAAADGYISKSVEMAVLAHRLREICQHIMAPRPS